MRDNDMAIAKLHPSYRNIGIYYAVEVSAKQLEDWACSDEPDQEELNKSGLAECEWYDCVNAALNLQIECGA